MASDGTQLTLLHVPTKCWSLLHVICHYLFSTGLTHLFSCNTNHLHCIDLRFIDLKFVSLESQCFPKRAPNLNVSHDFVLGNKIHCSPQNQSLSVKCSTTSSQTGEQCFRPGCSAVQKKLQPSC